MASPHKLTGETLIVHHIPLVHCQVPDRQGCSASKRTNPFCPPDVGVACTTSLPEWDLSQTDSLVYSSLRQASDTELAPAETAGNKEGKPSDFTSSGAHKRQNPFLLSDSDAPGDHLGDDPAQKSFHLHRGKSTFHLHELALPPFRLHDSHPVVKPWSATSRADVAEGQEDKLAREDAQKKSHLAADCMELEEYGCPRGNPSSFSFEQEWANDADELMPNQEAARSRTCSCSSSELQRCRCYSLSSQSEPLDQQMGYISDSSCNSSDGVLVNFSTLYHKMNGHAHSNRNSANLSCDSSSDSHSDTGAFYLDLHSSPMESKLSCKTHHLEGPGKTCECRHPSSPVLDANCNSYLPQCDPCSSEGSDLTACFQSQARLVVATQNYYKLVTCDLSSQSSPSPAGSSITSCSEEHTQASPLQPTEYYLFQRPQPQQEESTDTECSRDGSQGEAERNAIEGQVYVNISPPTLAGSGRQRSRSYDRHLDRSPTSRLGSLERMLSCPVKLSDSSALAIQGSPPKRVTSFAELAKGRKKAGSSPPLRTSRDSSLEFSPIPEYQKDGSVFLDDRAQHSRSLPPLPLIHSLSHSCEGRRSPERGGSASAKDMRFREMHFCGQAGPEQPFPPTSAEAGANSLGQKDIRARADGGAADSQAAVVRYSKDQRPTTLPIQPFVFQHHFPKQPKGRGLHSHFGSSLSQLYSLSAASRPASQQLSSASQSSTSATSADQPKAVGTLGPGQRLADGAASLGDGCTKKPVPEATRPSPLGSYSPVRSNVPFFQNVDSSSCTPTSENQPPRSRSCPVSANLLPAGPSPALGSQATRGSTHAETGHKKASPQPVAKTLPEQKEPLDENQLRGGSLPPVGTNGMSWSRAGGHADLQGKAGCSEPVGAGSLGAIVARPVNAHHLSPQALKWREYRRRNPLGLDRVSGLAGLTGSLDWRRQEGRLPWRNPILEFPGQSVKQLSLNYSDFFPDYFSLAEKPPAEFCLSPDGNTESVSIDLLQKKGLVKAINMAVDLIVAHFGTSRDPGVKAKLGNSSVSPNVGHLVLKYLCPAIRDLLSDGLKAYVLDVIVGQRRNIPWSVVEASTQLGPSTRVLHGLYSKVSQYPELTSHTMRFNTFILGLLNIRSLEFWFNHLYNHEDVIQAHYQPAGFLALSHGVCQGLFEEVLLLLQPLSLLPFGLDLLFEHHLLQAGQEQQQRKELLRTKQGLVLSAHSTLQLMRTRGSSSEGSSRSWASEQEKTEARVRGVGAPCRGGGKEAPSEPRKDKQASWWYQLMQSSQVYIEGSAEGSRFIRYERKKKADTGTTVKQAESRKGPPPREGVVEGAEACPITEVPVKERPRVAEPAEKQEPLTREEAKEESRPFWMGSPPDSELTDLKRSKERERGPAPKQAGLGQSSACSPEHSQPKWGHLFGSRKVSKEPKQANRMPSGWLSLDRSVFQLMAQTVGAGMWRETASEPERLPADCPLSCRKQQSLDRAMSLDTPCEVKALCHHIATEAGQLSFKKGDILRVASKVDADWLRCSRGAESGLVPIVYVTHKEDEDY
ncbi:AP-4 complex accessory subunit RUSC2 isoform X2 [Eublepharis macularius]|uniref:AP-4 complex accessory subunit RUSC2 isoform X2 n=1 Tax=Eublepharis macularius TaxID=481883 RepID=A0AA97L5F7_EUBMA|nr:AP-4 complex accessory subunit RUSC2 isoform X2 [Eublepharis macularius]